MATTVYSLEELVAEFEQCVMILVLKREKLEEFEYLLVFAKLTRNKVAIDAITKKIMVMRKDVEKIIEESEKTRIALDALMSKTSIE